MNFRIITSVFSVTWSFIDHCNMLICCSRNIYYYYYYYYYYYCWNQLCCCAVCLNTGFWLAGRFAVKPFITQVLPSQFNHYSLSMRCFKGGTMLFHAFRVVYTVKELNFHAKHEQSFKKQCGCIIEYFWGTKKKSYFWVRTSFGEFLSIVALANVNEGGTPYMGISPRRTRPCRHQPEREQEHAPSMCFIRLHCTRLV